MARGNPAKKGWDPIIVGRASKMTPMARQHYESDGRVTHYDYRRPLRSVEVLAFYNRLYDGAALVFEDGSMHLSFKRRDRAAVRDWRHFQAIKNSVAGSEREAIEIYPPESQLVDAANEYHLWVLPEGKTLPVGFGKRQVGDADDTLDWAAYRRGGPPGGRQREFEEGLPVGEMFILDAWIEVALDAWDSGWRDGEHVPQVKRNMRLALEAALRRIIADHQQEGAP